MPYVFIFPSIFYIVCFVVFPVGWALYASLSDLNLLKRGKFKFTGLQNYVNLFTESAFLTSLKNTIYFVLLFVIGVIVIGLALALITESLRKSARTVMRVVCFVPYVTSMSAVAVIWGVMYDANFGILNYLLSFVGIKRVLWLTSPGMVLNSIIILTLWRSAGFVMVLFIAGLVQIPSTYYDAARIDGAGRLRLFFGITLPLLKPTFLYVLVTQIISVFQVFTPNYILTKGGPGTASTTIVIEIINRAFRFYKMGEASAMAFILFAILLIFSLVQFRRLRTEFTY